MIFLLIFLTSPNSITSTQHTFQMPTYLPGKHTPVTQFYTMCGWGALSEPVHSMGTGGRCAGDQNVRKTTVMEWERFGRKLFTGCPRAVNTSMTSRRSRMWRRPARWDARLRATAPALIVTMRCRVADQVVTNRRCANVPVQTRRTLKQRPQRVVAGSFHRQESGQGLMTFSPEAGASVGGRAIACMRQPA